MSSSKFASMWKLMAVYQFEVDPDSMNEDMNCLICKKLMIDACRSACGCQFCYKCIFNYLENGRKYCPGGKDECDEEFLSLETDIWRNMRMNVKISKLDVKCPNNSCPAVMELSKVEAHLKNCNRQPALCPYVMIGCNNEEVTSDTMIKHMNIENLGHTKLLMEWIENLRIEVSRLEDNMEMNKVKMESLKNESKIKDIQIEDLRKEIESTKEEFWLREQSMEEELRHLKHLIELRLGLSISEKRIDEAQIRRPRRDTENIYDRGRFETESLNRKIENLKNEVKKMKEERVNNTKVTYPYRRQLSDSKDGKVNKNEREKVEIGEELNPNKDEYYVWRIYDWDKKIESMNLQPIFSEPFCLNNYKLCLRLYINGDQIGLFCFIMRGDNDNDLQWPLRRTVTISIINQRTLKAHKSASFHYNFYTREKSAFERPKVDMNYYCIGVYPFCLSSSLENRNAVTMNNSIVVSCTFSEPK